MFVSTFTLKAYYFFSMLYFSPFPTVATCVLAVNGPQLFGFGYGYGSVMFCPRDVPDDVNCEKRPECRGKYPQVGF
jgi:hypothetical protein